MEKKERLEEKRPDVRRFETLRPREILGLAIHIERSNARRFRAFAESFLGYDDEVSRRFEGLAKEEEEHERILVEEFGKDFGGAIPAVEEADVDVVIESVDLDSAEHQIFDSFKPLDVYRMALRAEEMARSFYNRAVATSLDASVNAIYHQLGAMEDDHVSWLQEKIRAAREAGE